jgi:signal transduction histidine kinase
MRIQTRLFLGTAALVLALMGLQWWFYARQLRSIEEELTNVAASVGKDVLTAEFAFFGGAEATVESSVWLSADEDGVDTDLLPVTEEGEAEKNVQVVVIPAPPDHGKLNHEGKTYVRRQVEDRGDGVVEEKIEWITGTGAVEDGTAPTDEHVVQRVETVTDMPFKARKLVLKVEDGDEQDNRFLVVTEDDRRLHRIQIPVSPTVTRIRENMREGAAVGGLLLMAGLFASALLASRMTRPLRSLAEGADLLGRGDLGVQVPESASGEVGDLQRAFNRMSQRLRELEGERQVWQQREHLAQLGDLSRGLAHTLRNPLHTLGLAVEELADGDTSRRDLVETSRAQIRRIDRWLRSFLALGAEESVEPEEIDLGDLVKGVVLESVQQGADIRVEERDELSVRAVPGAVRAAIGNLVENAAQASPAGGSIEVTMWRDGETAVVSIVDRGGGLPLEVKERMFSPHVTTKVGGAGMGLFLARQLIVGMHGGELELEDADGGGTAATVRLPIVGAAGGEDDSA